jgi:prepilin-type N-terminal cleavage/methylation domain-containing protein
MKAGNSRTGATLIEIIVVIAIIAVLAALLFPVLTRAKERALDSQEISQLKQMSVAHSIYVADYDDAEPGSSVPILASGYGTVDLVRSPLDPFILGWANDGRTGGPEPKVTYKDSFRTLKMSAGSQFFSAFRNAEAGGWLIAAGPHLLKFKNNVLFEPSVRYKRLTFAGGVVKRAFPIERIPPDTLSLKMDRCFADENVIP